MRWHLAQGWASQACDRVTPILVLGFEVLQPSRLPSRRADEETEAQTTERSRLRPLGHSRPNTLTPSPGCSLLLCTHFPPCYVGLALLFSTASGSRPALEMGGRLRGSLGAA